MSEQITCWNCGKANRSTEIICTYCGSVLKADSAQGATRQFETEEFDPQQFEKDGMLLLYVRHSGEPIKVYPGELPSKIRVGRPFKDGTMPEVDLTGHDGAKMGVSRLHMILEYEESTKSLIVSDPGSVNGLFLNGRKLAHGEERVLRDGDQLRLGQLILDVAFKNNV
ncbi:MAG: FHA domain-containing protein [Chloroflexota bacterium]